MLHFLFPGHPLEEGKPDELFGEQHEAFKAREYLAAHYLPNWYPLISEFAPATRVCPVDADMPRELRELNWGPFFVKDYVKSLKTSVGSVVREPSERRTPTRRAADHGRCRRRSTTLKIRED